jgi:ligand-binding SRPBCC domain-containing protein
MSRLFVTEQWLPRPRDEVFRFFVDAANLETLTPPWLKFTILSPMPMTMETGAKLEYKLQLHGFPMRWQSEITVWDPPIRFVDEQRHGPYRTWVHEHLFEAVKGGTLVKDRIQYAVPGGWLIDVLFVHWDLKRIFAFRRAKLSFLFRANSRTPN